MPAGGNIIKRKWLHYYDALPHRSTGRIILSLDTATKTNPENDYSVCTIWFAKEGVHYLIDVWRDKIDFPGLRESIVALYHHHRADTLLIEIRGPVQH